MGNTHLYFPLFVRRLSVNGSVPAEPADQNTPVPGPGDRAGAGCVSHRVLIQPMEERWFLLVIPGHLSVTVEKHRTSQGPFLLPSPEGKQRKAETRKGRGDTWKWGLRREMGEEVGESCGDPKLQRGSSQLVNEHIPFLSFV